MKTATEIGIEKMNNIERQKNKRTCNQCHNQMGIADKDNHYFCQRLNCPNFALLQIPVEFLDETSKYPPVNF